MKRSPTVSGFLILFYMFLAGLARALPGPAGPSQKAVVTTEDGVQVVRNPKTPVASPGGAPATVTLVEDLVIGDDTGKEDYWFSFLNSLAVDQDGNIYTLDPKAIRVRVFGPDGTLLRAFGRAGQGPGEFSGPGGIIAAPDGTILVSDVLARRISRFSAEGEHLKDTSHGTSNIGGLAMDGRGDFYAANYIHGEKPVWELVKLDGDLKPLLKIHTYGFESKPKAFSVFTPRLFFDVVGEDRLAWMVPDSYEIMVIDASGRPVRKITKDGEPRRLTAKDREEHLGRRFPGATPPGIEIMYPDVFPAAAGFMTDDAGRIYVRTYEPDGRGGEAVDVFDPEGLYVARFFVPWNEETVTVRKGKLYCLVRESASGNPLVKRYALSWK